MKKLMKLLLVGLLSISLIGCSNDSSSPSSDTSNNTVETETGSEDTSNEIVTTSSGNVISHPRGNWGIKNFLDDNDIDKDTIYSIKFLDSLDDMPSDYFEMGSGVKAWITPVEDVDEEYYNLYIAGDGGVDAPESSSYLFSSLFNLVSIDFNGCFYTGNTTSLYMCFDECASLQYIDLNSWDVSNVNEISYLFAMCTSLQEVKMDNWDVSNLEYTTFAFSGCYSLNEIDINSWDVSNVINVCAMFSACTSLTSIDLSNWMLDIENEEFECRGMFYNCSSLEEVQIGNLDVEDESIWTELTSSY